MLTTYRNAAIVFAIITIILLVSRPTKLAQLSPYQYVRTSGRGSLEILNSTLGFQEVFVVNLLERTDRRDAMALAAALTEIDVTWVDGVMGADVTNKVLPADSFDKSISRGNKGSWRAHMNALQTIIDSDLTSALILEDDADWDIRLKSQLQVFAQAARAFTQPTTRASTSQKPRPLALADTYNPPGITSSTVIELPFDRLLDRLPLRDLHPTITPYGDDWDVLWLGHCGTDFPKASSPDAEASGSEPQQKQETTNPNGKDKPPPPRPPTGYKPKENPNRVMPPILRIPISNDPTVPEPQHLKPHPFALRDQLGEEYPPHTRVVHASSGTICTQAYAVSQRGARKLLWQFGLESLTAGWDLMLRDWCDGRYVDGTGHTSKNSEGRRGGKRSPICVTVQPPLFSHHYGKGAASDITSPGGGFINKNKVMTPYVRYSVRLNMGGLVDGAQGVAGLVDQFPDA